MADAPRVFLSYSHDSDEHAARVLDLANALRRDGSNVLLDRYLQPRGPEEGWPLWMDRNICDADFVLMVCTATYLRRVLGEEKPGQGLGVRWEGKLIYNRIYHDQPSGSRFIPILLPGSVPAHIPTPVLGHNRYEIASFSHTDRGYKGLDRHLRNKPEVIAPPIGTLGEPVVWNVPYPRNRNFTGREAILKQLETALASGMPAALSQAIAGLGGVGKTQTAVEYAYRHRDHYRAVLWVRADTETSLASGYRALAEVLGLPEKDAQDSNEVVAAVRRWLGREPGYLLILDNADDPALVKPFLPPTPTGHVLLTSQAHNIDRLNIRRPIALPVLAPDEALAFLLRRTDREESLDSAEQDAARTLARELGYLPLALEQAAAYMVEHEEAFSVYLAAYHTLRLKLLDERGPVAGDYPETVRTTWKRSFDAVAEVAPASIALLRLSAFFAPDAIPYELILEGASELGELLAPALASPPGGAHALNQLLTPLARHSLVRRAPEARTYSVHRLVQAVLLDELAAADREETAERAVRALDQTFPNVDYATWPQCERLVPHALAARGWIESEDLRVPEAARLLNRAGCYLADRARYAEVEPLYRRALALREQALGPDHPHTAQSLNNLALLYYAQGQYAAAEPLYRRALAIYEQALGPDHPHTAQSLNNLALLYDAQGQYAAAEPLYRRALALREQALGPDHPHTARSLNNLALLYHTQGQYAAAEPLYRRALALREQALGPDHPDTARSLNNLALLYHAQGQYAAAEPLLRRVLAIYETIFGPEHPQTGTCRANLAALLSRPDRGRARPRWGSLLDWAKTPWRAIFPRSGM
jgi:tetratricopeptide (TPR) repeat protein